ncbi:MULTISPECIES: hypothetical protein [Pseudoalteromonas]|uniref:hypothetical protein n=1 Tax=Pseudoalteromonas TaxID=53246 RepID=UPI00272D1382|nr:hypothetical protein [Pseudoalteromonas sp.]
MYKSSLITIIWLCILSFIPDQASAQTHQAASSSNKGFNVPEELLTTWELDEAASMEYAKKSAHWNEHIANLMPKLIATNKQIKYRFNQDEMVTIQAAKEHELAIRLIKQTLTSYKFKFEFDDKPKQLQVIKAAGGRINIQADGLLGYQFLLWKKRRERLTGV